MRTGSFGILCFCIVGSLSWDSCRSSRDGLVIYISTYSSLDSSALASSSIGSSSLGSSPSLSRFLWVLELCLYCQYILHLTNTWCFFSLNFHHEVHLYSFSFFGLLDNFLYLGGIIVGICTWGGFHMSQFYIGVMQGI